ncbi:cytochrome P450 [Dentipellis sp. KUC8613]|nr:cytochrome P450 [Dentipellis sp. KUC8613]
MGAVYSTALTGLVIIGSHRVYIYLRHVTGLSYLPSPPLPSYIWGHTIDLRKAVVGTRYNVWRKTLGNTYKLYEPLMEPVLVLGDPKGVSHVLNTNVTNYHRPEIDKYILRMWFGRSLLNVEDEEHSKMRKQLNPAFTPQSVKEVSHVFFELAHRLAGQWDEEIGSDADSTVFSITSSIHTFSLNAISMTMFAHDPNASAGTIPTLLRNITNGPSADNTFTRVMGILVGKFPQLLALPNPMKTWAGLLRTELGKIASEVWEEGQGDPNMEAKVIRVLSKPGKDGEVVSKDEAVAQIIGLLFAGSETVANVMGELFYELARQPSIQDKLRAELAEFERTHGHAPDIDDLTRTGDGGLPYLEAVTRETMRCKAVLMDISRCAVADDVIPLSTPIAGTSITELAIKAGTTVSIPVRDGVNVDPAIWGPDAHVFRPERWLEEGGLPESVRSIHALGNILTFGDGPKICLGRNFALAEFKVVASTLIPRFELKPDGSEIDFYHLGGNTVKPKVRGREAEGVQLPLLVKRLR